MKQIILLVALFGATVAVAQAPLDPSKPDFTGIWHRIDYRPAAAPQAGKPPLLPAAAKVYAAHKAAALRGDHSFDTSSICLPEGIPRLMLKSEPFEILQRPTLVAFNFQINRLPRVVYMKSTPPPDDGGYYLGEATGKWEGDTLVIDTRGFNDQTLLDDSGLPHGEALHVTERLHLEKGGARMTDQITIEDPETFSAPWGLTAHYERLQNIQLPEDVCAERVGSSRPHREK